jgi:hypothetical protein
VGRPCRTCHRVSSPSCQYPHFFPERRLRAVKGARVKTTRLGCIVTIIYPGKDRRPRGQCLQWHLEMIHHPAPRSIMPLRTPQRVPRGGGEDVYHSPTSRLRLCNDLSACGQCAFPRGGRRCNDRGRHIPVGRVFRSVGGTCCRAPARVNVQGKMLTVGSKAKEIIEELVARASQH